MLLMRAYKSAEYRFAMRYVPTDCDMVELGASIGVMTSHLARRMEPGKQLIAVEADARLIPLIERNLADNAAGREVALLQCAVDYSGRLTVEFSVGDSSLASNGPNWHAPLASRPC